MCVGSDVEQCFLGSAQEGDLGCVVEGCGRSFDAERCVDVVAEGVELAAKRVGEAAAVEFCGA